MSYHKLGGGRQLHLGQLHRPSPECRAPIVDTLNYREYALYLVICTDDTERIAGENTHRPVRHKQSMAATLYARHIDAIFLAQVGVHQPVAHKGTAVADRYKRQMHVADQIVVLARATQLALIEIVEKSHLHMLQALAQTPRRCRASPQKSAGPLSIRFSSSGWRL